MQKRLNEFQQEILSFDLNEKYSGIITTSVYRGFDLIQARTGLDFELNHTLTGEIFTRKNLTLSNRRGIWVTRQGTVIIEDAPIKVSILANQYNYERWDVLVGDHTHDELAQGGLEATYTVIPGGDMSEPFGLSETQTIIGRIKVPPNAISSVGVIWERRPIPQLGGKIPALLAEQNIFENQNSDKHRIIATTIQSFDGQQKGLLQGMSDANSYFVDNINGFTLNLLPRRPLGTLISLTFKSNVTLSGYSNQLVGTTNNLAGYNDGYRPLSLFVNNPSLNFQVMAGETATFRLVDVGLPTTKRPYGEFWSLVGLTDTTGKALEASSLVTSLVSRVTNLEEASVTNADGIRALDQALVTHAQNQSNPHAVTKAQVGLGNLPNVKSDAIASDDSESLATSKAVKILKDEVDTVRGIANTALGSSMPKGGIIMWSGSIENIPANYVLCDGRPAINGLVIPDLRNKFIRGASDLSNTSTLDSDSRGQVAQPAPVNAQGGNNRYSLSLSEIPPHTHSYYWRDRQQMVLRGTGSASALNWAGETDKYDTTGSAGGSSGTAQEFNLMPQWYALAFIIKVI